MPMPKPNSGESQDAFMSRCMSDPVMVEDFDDTSQRYAVCQRQWEQGGKAMKRKTARMQGVKLIDEKQGTFEAVFATLNVKDKDGDVIMPGALGEDTSVRISAYNHASWGGALPVGKGTATEDGEELKVRGQFFMNTEAGRETYETVKALGDLTEWSFGFDVQEQESGMLDSQRANFIRSMKVYEVSPVLLGAGVNTRTTDIKSYDPIDQKGLLELAHEALVEDDAEGALEIIDRMMADREEEPDEDGGEEGKGEESDGEEGAEESAEDDEKAISEYPHHKADGSVDFEAVAKAMASIIGATKAKGITDDDRQRVYDHLAAHYREFDEEPPELRSAGSGGFKGHIVIAREAVTDVAERARSIKRIKAEKGQDFGDERRQELIGLAEAMEKSAAAIREAAAPSEVMADSFAVLAAIKLRMQEANDGY